MTPDQFAHYSARACSSMLTEFSTRLCLPRNRTCSWAAGVVVARSSADCSPGHIEQYGRDARCCTCGAAWGLADFELLTRTLFRQAYGTDARCYQAEHVAVPEQRLTWNWGAGSAADYAKYQGRSFTLLLVDAGRAVP